MKKKILAGILAFTVCMCGFSESVSASDNRTAYLERYGEYFDIYSCVAEFSNGSTVYSYLVKDKNDVEKIVPETGFKLKDVITLSQNELYYTMKPDKTDEYKAQFENDQESKPFMVTVVVRDENSGETKYYSVGSRDEAKKKAEELGLSEGEYEIEEKWAGGAAVYSYEPEQYDKVRTVQYLDENYKVIDTVELSGKNFAYNVADGTEHIRFVSGTEPADTTCEIMPGDIYSDGIIDLSDLTTLSLFLVGDNELTNGQQKSADVDSDGAVTLADLARLRQYLSKKIDTLETSYSPEDITDKCRTNVTEDPSGIPVSVGNSVMVNWFLAAAVPKAEVDPSEVASVDFIGISETETIK